MCGQRGFCKCPQYFCGEKCDRLGERRNLWERQELRKKNMSEVVIKIRKLQDNGSTFRANPETLYLGGIGSAQVDRLRFELPKEWEDCAVTLHVQRMSGALPTPQVLDYENSAPVTKNWTAEKRGLWMLSAIGGDGYRAMTKPARYECYETLETTGEEDIPQSMYEKFVETIRGDAKNARKSAAEAKASEETAAASAGAAADSAAESEDAARRAKASAEESAVSAEKSAASENAAKKYSESAKDAIANAKKDYSGGYLKTYDLTAVQADWKPLDPARGPYHYSCDIPVEELTDQFSPFAATGLESYAAAVAAGVANAVETRNGALRLFAMRVPAADIDLVLTLFGVGTLSYELTLPVTDWKQMEAPVGPNRYCCDVPVAGCLATLTPLATTGLENFEAATPAGLASVVETYDGFVRFYAVRQPEANIDVILMLLRKEEPVNRPATRTELGLVKIGDGMDVDSGGGISTRAATDEEFEDMMEALFHGR